MSNLWHLLAQLGDDDCVVLDGPGTLGEVVDLAQVGVPVEPVQVLRKKGEELSNWTRGKIYLDSLVKSES